MSLAPGPDVSVAGTRAGASGRRRAFIDLHCHTRASFDSLASWQSVVAAATSRGLTHLAITDHDRIDAALAARAAAPRELTVIVGEEVRTADGDLICLFLDETIAPGRPAAETIAAVRRQGGLVGIPHPFDGFRGSLLRADAMRSLAADVDWLEAFNARVLARGANERAAELALEQGLPGVAVSDAHTVLEVGVACTLLYGDPATPAGLLEALAGPVELVTGRASFLVRALTPLAKAVQRARGNGRVRPAAAGPDGREARA